MGTLPEVLATRDQAAQRPRVLLGRPSVSEVLRGHPWSSEVLKLGPHAVLLPLEMEKDANKLAHTYGHIHAHIHR